MCRKISIVFVLAVMVVATGIAFAWVQEPCQQSIEGTWDVRIWGGESGSEQCWGECVLTVTSSGAVAATGSYLDCDGGIWSITGGHLTISDGCVIEGELETDGGTIQFVNGGAIEETIYFARIE